MVLSKKIISAMYFDCMLIALFIMFPIIAMPIIFQIDVDTFFTTLTLGATLILCTTLRPLLFKNASIGMKVFGLAIVDAHGNVPPPRMIIYRSLSLSQLGREWKKRWLEKEDVYFWGLSELKTHIVLSDAPYAKEPEGLYHLPSRTRKRHIHIISPVTNRKSYVAPVIGLVVTAVLYFGFIFLYLTLLRQNMETINSTLIEIPYVISLFLAAFLAPLMACRYITEILFVRANNAKALT